MKPSPFQLIRFHGRTYVVTIAPVFYNTEAGTRKVPAGFISDGASIPCFFWRLIGHPFDLDYLTEAVCHDHMYRLQDVSRKFADRWFFRALERHRVRRVLFLIALRLFGWIAWERNRRRLHR